MLQCSCVLCGQETGTTSHPKGTHGVIPRTRGHGTSGGRGGPDRGPPRVTTGSS